MKLDTLRPKWVWWSLRTTAWVGATEYTFWQSTWQWNNFRLEHHLQIGKCQLPGSVSDEIQYHRWHKWIITCTHTYIYIYILYIYIYMYIVNKLEHYIACMYVYIYIDMIHDNVYIHTVHTGKNPLAFETSKGHPRHCAHIPEQSSFRCSQVNRKVPLVDCPLGPGDTNSTSFLGATRKAPKWYSNMW